ncbi:MAG: protease-4 [Polaribacter sp.]|jgi:protease-4
MTKLFKSMWFGLDLTRKIFLNVLFFGFLVFLVIAISNSDGKPTVEKGIALVLAPNGNIVEQLTYQDPVDKAMQEATGNENAPETLLYDLIFALDQAKDDDRITSLVISTNYLWGIGMTKMQDLAVAIEDFKTSGKPVIAYSDYFSQGQYFLASQADEVVMNPQGGIFLTGFSRIGTYYKGMLDKLGVNVHVFKVGEFKSAVEPFLRNNMSDAAKEANLLWMGDLWGDFKIDLAKNRGLTPNDLDSYIENYKESLVEHKGNSAKMALDAGLVDRLATRIQFRNEMIAKTGLDNKTKSFKHITHSKYIKAIRSPMAFPSNKTTPKVAVITTKGTIVDGEAKEGTIGGDTIARQIRKTRLNKNVKAIVLRVDSGGGSAFASEVIRQELVQAQADGIKVIASMGDVAASGGYWISASSDEIWAMPTTITGSIGIFGMIPTFEKPLNDFGIYRDGVGTTKYANPVDVGMPLSDDVATMIQTGIDSGYQKFIGLVANSRNMSLEEVDNIAQGRVWSGKRAKDLGLVDELGSLNDAIKSAAKLAGLENYDVLNVKRKLTENELFLKELFSQSKVESLMQERQQARVKPSIQSKLYSQFKGLVSFANWNDPNNAYANCFCEIQ